EEDAKCHLLQYWRWNWDEGWLRLACEVTVIVLVIFQILLDVRDIRRIGRAKWFSVLPNSSTKCPFILVLCEIPIRFSCHLHDAFLAADNFIAAIAVVLTTLHYLYYWLYEKFEITWRGFTE
ncbi:hypothetical protein OSTOST_24754, partial [Ostertagia ostertagi]